ncbi:AraC family transcriptional regulator [Actinocatenispora rupis]|uniref:Transcriptional regulator n=1 Tax=Actinocatenispora rupis TaxID=519421 RepID=A0A8J3N9N9_9ACTN|nr:transcriptional regulator [Actinocatenispora rupis]
MTVVGAVRETARYWRHPALPGIDLLRARYVSHRFTRHTHDAYAIGLVRLGVEEYRYRGGLERAGAGGIPIVNPDMVHTGHAGVPDGWAYRMLYPTVPVVRSVADELGLPPGTPWFPTSIVYEPELARTLLAAHRAADAGDALTASSLTRLLLARLLSGYAAHRPAVPAATSAGARVAETARDVLLADLTDPPSLEDLAARLGTGPFALLRAFRGRYGMPPHTWLTQQRVSTARTLLDAGVRPADAALRVGFVDQAHLSRHFRRILGVPPGAYQRGRSPDVADGAAGTGRRIVQETGSGSALPSGT